jgi:hypothetical protein
MSFVISPNMHIQYNLSKSSTYTYYFVPTALVFDENDETILYCYKLQLKQIPKSALINETI